MIQLNWAFLAMRMNWLYRTVAAGLVVASIFLLVDDLRAPTGLQVLLPRKGLFFAFVWLMLVPAAANFLNSLYGPHFRLLHWSLVLFNACLIAFGVFEAARSGVEQDTFLVLSLFLMLLFLSLFLAWRSDVASREGQGSVTFS